MNRLTYRKRDGNYSIKFDLGNLQQVDIEANNKLGHLEDIEEKLGIELPDMFNIYEKICKQNFVYAIENEKIIKEDLGSVRHVINPKEKQFEAIYLDAIATYKFVDYRKKWALTRKEIEENDKRI